MVTAWAGSSSGTAQQVKAEAVESSLRLAGAVKTRSVLETITSAETKCGTRRGA